MIKSFLDKIGKNLIKFQVKQKKLPSFTESKQIRMHVIFDGFVQGVGFRVEVTQLAMRLDLTGWIKNLPDSSVEAELQGEKEKIDYLFDSIQDHKRLKVNRIDKKKIKTVENEPDFKIEV